MTITIDSEFKSFIPPLRKDEFKKLKESIREEGCREPLVIWKGHDIILDGHHRFRICRDLGIDYRTVEMEFEDRDHAKLWVLRNQLGRRNLSDLQFKLLVGQEYELEHKLDGRPSESASEKLDQNDQVPKGSTRDRLAKEHGISQAAVQRSANLYNSVKTIGEVAPEVAREIESESIKPTQKDIVALGVALGKASPEEKEQLVEDIKDNFKKAAKKVSSKKPKKPKKEPEVVLRLPRVLKGDLLAAAIQVRQAQLVLQDALYVLENQLEEALDRDEEGGR